MNGSKKTYSIADRWEADIQSYKDGAMPLVSIPQCETCTNYIKGSALHCKRYGDERKPRYVMFPEKECPNYEDIMPVNLDIQNDKESKVYGALFGFCIGDILGVPVEFSTREEREEDPVMEMRAYGTYHQPFGTWSDDSSLMLCLIDAINRDYSIKQVANNFVAFYKKGDFTPHGRVFDIGNSTSDAIAKMCKGVAPIDCGGKSEYDNGNGSLMRILPLAFYGTNLPASEKIKQIESVSALTHGHNRSKLACIFYVEFALQLYKGCDKEEALEKAILFVHKNCSEVYQSEFCAFERLLTKNILNTSENEIKSTGYVVDTLEAVIWTFFHTKSYSEAVLSAVNLGGDTDTIAALVGGIAGMYYGVKDIQGKWLQSVVKKEELYQMFQQFLERI